MANETILDLPTVSNALLTDVIPAVQGTTTVQESLQQILSLMQQNIILNYAGNPNNNVAGTLYQLLYDTTNSKEYICTTAGSSTVAVWTLIGANVVGTSQGGTGVNSPSITAFNNITGFSASSTTGSTSSNLVFSNAPTLAQPIINGVTNGSSAASGVVGELIKSTIVLGSAVSVTSNTPISITSITLSAGDWDIWGQIGITSSGATTMGGEAAISLTDATVPNFDSSTESVFYMGTATFIGTDLCFPTGTCCNSVSTPTTYYLVLSPSTFTGTVSAYGTIFARRRR